MCVWLVFCFESRGLVSIQVRFFVVTAALPLSIKNENEMVFHNVDMVQIGRN